MMKDLRDTVIFAVTPQKKCVGIKVFSEPFQSKDINTLSTTFENNLNQCIESAFELKSFVENGDINADRRIIQNPPIENLSREILVRSHLERMDKMEKLRQENQLIDLGRAMIQSAKRGALELDVCKICLAEMNALTKTDLTPLMLKKNPQIVLNTVKLCRYADTAVTKINKTMLDPCEEIQTYANTVLGGFKKVMHFNGSNEEFVEWFNESVKIFHELTANIGNDKRRELTLDPENTLIDRLLI